MPASSILRILDPGDLDATFLHHSWSSEALEAQKALQNGLGLGESNLCHDCHNHTSAFGLAVASP